MAKRGGSELNHDNWDREDEKEEAGNFQAATADELKGRVIKRARRRNVGDTGGAEKKNAFASFGGFGAKPEGQTASFSFGSKTGTEGSDKPAAFGNAFSFGLSQPSDQKSVFGSQTPSFGSAAESQKVKPSGFGTEAFSFGSKTPSSTGTGGSTFSLSSSSSFSFSGSSSKPGAVFGSGGGGAGDPPPGEVETKTEDQASPLKSTKPASESAGFMFGAGASPAPAPTSLFSFGATKSSDPPAGSGSGGFVFGSKISAPSQDPPKAASPGFKFGEAKPAKVTEKDSEKDKKDLSASLGFLFSKSDSPAKIAPFSFNSEAKKDPSPKEVSASTNTVAIMTNSNSVGSVTKTSTKHSQEYLSHLKALNNQVLSWLKLHIESNPLVILSPVFKDYETHLEDINKKYGPQETSPDRNIGGEKEKEPIKETPKAFSFGASSGTTAPTTTAPAQPGLGSSFSFGSSTAKSDNPTSTSASAFSFSVNSAAPAPTFGAFSFGSSSASSVPSVAPAAAAEAEDDEDQPPTVEVKQVEEHDAVYSKKCKLFYRKDGQYKEKGVGMLHLKSVDEGKKSQLLVRADTNLGNVLLNILLSSQMATTRVGKNNVMIVCVPNPPIDPKVESSEPCPMLLRSGLSFVCFQF